MWKERWQRFWTRYGNQLLLGGAFLLVGVFTFEAGLLQKSLGQPTPVIIRVADTGYSPAQISTGGVSADSAEKVSTQSSQTTESTPVSNCQFVGSKKSNKYHHPASRCAKQIKAENKRCFQSAEDAAAKGYLPGCLEP